MLNNTQFFYLHHKNDVFRKGVIELMVNVSYKLELYCITKKLSWKNNTNVTTSLKQPKVSSVQQLYYTTTRKEYYEMVPLNNTKYSLLVSISVILHRIAITTKQDGYVNKNSLKY